jgi:hypothetical protein
VPPPAIVAVNWWTEPPCALAALQPVQLVSMEPVRGVTEKAVFREFAVTGPLPQPASPSNAGAKSSGKILENSRMVTIPGSIFYSIDFIWGKVKRTAWPL